MANPIADVMVHIDESLSVDSREEIRSTLRDNEYITSADFPPEREHMMLVTYNADRISAQDILGMVEQQGVRAELVGM